MSKNKNKKKEVFFGLYEDEGDLINAVKTAKASKLDILDVYTPFPVHGLDPALGLKESRLHVAGFVYGAIGTITAFGLMTWIFTTDWPIIFGGKPYFAAPSFIPITFELTVLFAAIGMTVSFYLVNGLAPGVTNVHLDSRITDDKFCIAFDTSAVSDEDKSKIQSFFEGSGASEVHTKVLS